MEAENYLIIEVYSYKGKRQGKVLMPLIQRPSFTEPDFRALKDAHFGCFVLFQNVRIPDEALIDC